VSPVQIKIC